MEMLTSIDRVEKKSEKKTINKVKNTPGKKTINIVENTSGKKRKTEVKLIESISFNTYQIQVT